MEVHIRIIETKYEIDIRERRYVKKKPLISSVNFPFLSMRHELFIYKPWLVFIMKIC